MKKIILKIDGMTCSACSNGLEKFLNKQAAIKEASVNLIFSNVSIEYDETSLTIKDLEDFVKNAGFKSLGEYKIEDELIDRNNKKYFIIFLIATLLIIFLIFILFNDTLRNTYPYYFSLAIISIFFIIYGFDILKNGFKSLILNTPNMDTLVTVSVGTSFLYSIYNLILILFFDIKDFSLYFESSAFVIYFVKLGRLVEGTFKDKTKDAIKKLVTITPPYGLIKQGNIEKGYIEKKVTLDEINVGDIVVSRKGEKISVDGEVVNGSAYIDEAFITGESKPRNKVIGSKVLAGSVIKDGMLEYKAEKIGKESTVSKIVTLVAESSGQKITLQKICDKVSGYFVYFIFLVSLSSFFIHLLLGSTFRDSFTTFITLLVISCPCALGLAAPLAVVVSVNECLKRGILIKNNKVLENAMKTNVVVFDKTGTLTYGTLKISKIINYGIISNEDILKIVGSIEAKDTHPISFPFKEYLSENKIKGYEVLEFENFVGMGLKAKIDNDIFLLGSSKILEKFNVENKRIEDEKSLGIDGCTIVYVVKNNEIISLIGLKDEIRESSYSLVDTLKENKIKTIMLTGDNNEVAKQVSLKLGIDETKANLMPQEKFNIIDKLNEDNNFVMMIGDGINDAPSLKRAFISVAIDTGADVTLNLSQVIIKNNNLENIFKLITISKKTLSIIKLNLFFAFLYNFIAIFIASGLLKAIFNVNFSINPSVASVVMVLSSLVIILNTFIFKIFVAKIEVR